MAIDKFGYYEIRGFISRGGMATVYHAYDARFDRDVAIKVLPREFSQSPKFRARFEREAKTIAALEHPAIVPVYDLGEENGQPYIVMRYMSGGSLADRLNRGPIEIENIIQMMARLAPALDAAHRRGIIHRDLKPGNILFDQYENAFISDFGIARLAQPDSSTLTGETILGTPAYMSPEQVQKEKEEIGGRSDIYSMGVILFQCLSGTVPFHSDNPAKIMVMHILEPVPSLLSRKPDLPPALEGVVEKAMAKNPDDRYGTTTELASAFEAAVSTEAIALPLPIVNGAEVTPQGARPPDTLIFAPTGALPQPTLATTATPLPSVKPAERRKIIPVIWAAVGVILLIFLAFLLGGNMFSSRPTPTPTLDLTEVFLVEQASYTPTPPPRPPSPILGGADKAAILIDSEIWQMNLDGSQLDQITTDGEEKTNPHWSIDGQAILYIAGKCLKSVNIYTGLVERIFCLEDIDTFNSFDISPDGKQMALSLNQAALYIIDNDYERLRQTTASSELSSLASCPNFAPIRSDIRQPRLVRWSDDQGLAVLHSEIWQGKPSDAIRVLDIGDCVEQPSSLFSLSPKLFLFTLRGYYDNQTIPSFDWNGQAQFVLNSLIQNIGYGDLNTYNMVENTMQQLNPIQKSCCYQNAQWSPDQRYLFFTHQPETSKDIFLYYVTTQAAAAGVELPPLSISEGVFSNTTSLLQVDLRPSK